MSKPSICVFRLSKKEFPDGIKEVKEWIKNKSNADGRYHFRKKKPRNLSIGSTVLFSIEGKIIGQGIVNQTIRPTPVNVRRRLKRTEGHDYPYYTILKPSSLRVYSKFPETKVVSRQTGLQFGRLFTYIKRMGQYQSILEMADSSSRPHAQHVAIKCTYNNGDEDDFVGFSDICSEDIIKWNIEHGRIWCSQKDCGCREYYDRGFRGKRPVEPCYESVLFRDWQYGAGWYHTGSRAGTPIHLSNVEKGKIAILTTRFPGDVEENRRIIGFFKIGEVEEKPGEETMLIADQTFAVRLPMEEAKELFFWDYYSTRGGARWGTGLIRYLNDDHVSRILLDLRDTIRNGKVKGIVNNLLARDFPKVPPPASGPRIKKSGSRTRRVSIARKYGSVGEGIEHRKLKEWVARNPKSIGLVNVKKTYMEYVFLSGDVCDIVFKLARNHYAIVEIETTNPLPGCYQALKYRILKCAELGMPITSSCVEAILVAWSVPRDVKNFCTKYGVRFVRKKMRARFGLKNLVYHACNLKS